MAPLYFCSSHVTVVISFAPPLVYTACHAYTPHGFIMEKGEEVLTL
jgi:hypothetical protein